jgi:hypothetical protein
MHMTAGFNVSSGFNNCHSNLNSLPPQLVCLYIFPWAGTMMIISGGLQAAQHAFGASPATSDVVLTPDGVAQLIKGSQDAVVLQVTAHTASWE